MENIQKEGIVMPALFGKNKKGKEDKGEEVEKPIPLGDQKEELEEDVSLLEREDKSSVQKVISEVRETIREATRASLRLSLIHI